MEKKVMTQYGPVRGLEDPKADGVTAFRGIPYAAAPVEGLRWRPPAPHRGWRQTRDCTAFAPSCPQPDLLAQLYGESVGPTSEDCLYLNVWTPAGNAGEKLPVMVWIHGGGFFLGSGSMPMSTGERLATRGVVTVSLNYRLGPLGFMAHPELMEEYEHGACGNYGLLDQVAALAWVRENIAAFGGDPENVTIFGESAGAVSVAFHMVSPLSSGLFRRAIAQSGSCFGLYPHLREKWFDLEPAIESGRKLAKQLDIAGKTDQVEAMRLIPSEELVRRAKPVLGAFFGHTDGIQYQPCVDGRFLPDAPGLIFARGQVNAKEFIAGFNADEMTIFLAPVSVPDIPAYEQLMRTYFKHRAGEVMALYPAASDDEAKPALVRALGHAAFGAGSRAQARFVNQAGGESRLYYYTRVKPNPMARLLGCFHGSEISTVFGSVGDREGMYGEYDLVLSEKMGQLWASFAATGLPQAEGAPPWPPYTAEADIHLELGDEIKTGQGLLAPAFNIFEELALEQLKNKTA